MIVNLFFTFSPGLRLATALIETDVPRDTDKVSLWRFAFDLAKTTWNKIIGTSFFVAVFGEVNSSF